ncbi:hypothetical protein ACF0H5_004074 [Mactra antiquata]
MQIRLCLYRFGTVYIQIWGYCPDPFVDKGQNCCINKSYLTCGKCEKSCDNICVQNGDCDTQIGLNED